jgi:hypothetical protein
MKNKTPILFGIIFTIISLTFLASAEPERMLPVCISGCHTERNIEYGYSTDPECGTCHIYVSKSFINIPVLEQNHNPKTCKLCHMASGSGTFHTLHETVNGSCNRCHGETGSARPDKTFNDCGGCHGGQIHDIHEQNLSQICLRCHGVIPSKKLQESPTVVNQFYTKVIDYQRYTLYELIKRLLGW